MGCLDNLNKEQYQAATIVDGYELMLAGAGTGKTHTLISRVAYMIEQGVNPSSILLLTFTNKAAKEMQQRLQQYVGDCAKNVKACTFHSFAINKIFAYGARHKFSPNYSVLSSSDDLFLLKQTRDLYFEDNGFHDNQKKSFPSISTIENIISSSVNSCKSLLTVIQNQIERDKRELTNSYSVDYKSFGLEAFTDDVINIVDIFKAKKQFKRYLNYDDMLVEFNRLLDTDAVFRRSITSAYTHVLCDEYQDTNTLQEQILQKLVSDNGNLCVVGDDNQSIYKFRDANISNILNFEKTHVGCKTVALLENYRSSQEILDVSNAMMKYAKEGIPKQLHGQFHGDRPQYWNTFNIKQSVGLVLDEVEKNHAKNVSLSEQAVLVRNVRLAAFFEQECIRRRIPYVKYGGRPFFESKNVQYVINVLKLFFNDKDEIAWRRILDEYKGVGPKSINNALIVLEQVGLDFITNPVKHQGLKLPLPVASAMSDFSLFWSKMQSSKYLSDKIKVIADYLKIQLDLCRKATKSGDIFDKITNRMSELMVESNLLVSMSNSYVSTIDFLNDLSLDSDYMKNRNLSNDKFVISTIHSAKGLEWDNVYVIAPVDEIFAKIKDEENEELRIMYVALTRARKKLTLVQPFYMQDVGIDFETTMYNKLNHNDVRACFDFFDYRRNS